VRAAPVGDGLEPLALVARKGKIDLAHAKLTNLRDLHDREGLILVAEESAPVADTR
jgi:hypothetical protein